MDAAEEALWSECDGDGQYQGAGQEEDGPPTDEERAAYMESSAGSRTEMDAFRAELLENANRPRILTGFDELDGGLLDGGLLDGGLYPGLYVPAAIPGLGKTSLVLQIADNIAAAGHDVLFFALEMTKAELKAKSMSRITWTRADGRPLLARTTLDILDLKRHWTYSPEELAHMEAAITEYGETFNGHLWIFGIGEGEEQPIGVDDIQAAVERHKTMTGNAPVVFVDYLQLLRPTLQGGTDKQNADQNVLALRALSAEYKTPVIAISSLNRSSYDNPYSMGGFKETGTIEYSGGLLIRLYYCKADGQSCTREQATIDTGDGVETLRVGLHVQKSRHGRSGTATMIFRPAFNHFTTEAPPASAADLDKGVEALLAELAKHPEGLNRRDLLQGRTEEAKAIRKRVADAAGLRFKQLGDVLEHGERTGALTVEKDADSTAKTKKPDMIRAARSAGQGKDAPTPARGSPV